MSGRWADSQHHQRRTSSGWDQAAAARRILRRDQHQCYYRGPDCTGHATEVDHVRPLSRGGSDTDDNKRAICVPCHRAKTKLEAAAGRAGRSRQRPAESHPGMRPAS